MRRVVDAHGGDNAPGEVVKGCVQAVRELGVEIVLAGRETELERLLGQEEYPKDKISVKNADEVITNDDSPVQAIRNKKGSSLVVALEMVKKKEADAVVSAGNTGAYLAGAFRILGRLKGVRRPALATFMPNVESGSIVLDVGANTDCKAENLLQFAAMGSLYAENVLNIKAPRVALVNIGAEEGKGNELIKEAYPLLQASGLNFTGNIEARRIPYGDADVVVCDGFVGNVVLKLTEGVGLAVMGMLKDALMKNSVTKLCAAALKPGLKTLKKKLDYSEYGGAPLLGIDGVVIKAHGSSDAKAFYNAIKSAVVFAGSGVNEKIRVLLAEQKEESEHEC